MQSALRKFIPTMGFILGICAAYPSAAQFNNGAVIVTVPNTSGGASEPARKAQPKPKKRRVTRPKRSRPKPVTRAPATNKIRIVVLVNDDPITQYEVDQRARLLASREGVGKKAQTIFRNLVRQPGTNKRLRAILQQTVEANRGKTREQILAIFEKRKKAYGRQLQRLAVSRARAGVMPRLRKKAIEELIDERLKLQAAKQAKLLISKAEVDRVMTGIAKRNKLSMTAFKRQLKRNGTDVNAMRQRVRASLSWMRLVGAKFGRFIDVNQKAIDESVSNSSDAEKVSLHLHQITLGLPSKLSQTAIAKRMAEAEALRKQFRGCDSSRTLAGTGASIIFRDLGYRIATAVPEPTRSMLLNANNGDMVPPVATNDGVTLYAVCGRRTGNSSFAARERAVRQLRERGTEVYARKYLTDLRREAHIEYR